MKRVWYSGLLLAGAGLVCLGAAERPRAGGSRQPVQNSTCSDVPAHPYDIILGRPTNHSMTVSVMCAEDAEGFIEYGTVAGKLDARTPALSFKKGAPAEVVLESLRPDMRYYYALHAGGTTSAEYTFHTARRPGSAFTFTITADSHLDEHTDPKVYLAALAQALADQPDFHIDLGDTFMAEKHLTREAAARQYVAQRYYFGQLCHSAPLILVLGNHDGESQRGRGGDSENLAVWANGMRQRYFSTPVPDAFYSGNNAKHAEAGLLADYYAWDYGDALFVVLDPFWHTAGQRRGPGNWKRTLGLAQDRWLQSTLEASKAKFKFVFIHHLVGGLDDQSRGGAEAATLYEWGGKDADGSDAFKTKRPGWPMPIHELLKKHHVTAVFHGHDHLYARQELDGIIYQEVPQPGDPRGSTRSAAEYGYKSGDIQASSGHLRVKMAGDEATVDYIRSNGTDGARDQGAVGKAAATYKMKAYERAKQE